MRVAVIDCGTHAFRLLVAEADGAGGLREVTRRLQFVSLGQDVDATHAFHPDALARTFAAAESYASTLAELGVQRVRFVATSAARDVSNRDEFFAGIEQRLGVKPDVLAGTEEARLSFVGALTGVRVDADPVLVMDIGGGSTELVLGLQDGTVERAVSLDMGSLRLRERYLTDDPPSPHQVLAALTYVEGLLDRCGVDLASVATFIGVAGTVTTLSAAHQQLPSYLRERVHGSSMSRDDVAAIASKLLTSTVAEVRRIPSMHPARAELICGGALIASCVAERVGTPRMLISENDILDGAALELLGSAEPGASF